MIRPVTALALSLVLSSLMPCPAVEAQPQRRMLTIERIHADPPITGRSPIGIAWVPDSKAISYLDRAGGETDGETHLILAAVPSGKTRTLCIADTVTIPADLRKEKDDDKFSIGSYQWAKKGGFLAFLFRGEIFTLDGKSGAVTRRTKSEEAESNLTISPDGRWIAFSRSNDLWAIDVGTGDERRLTTTGSDSLLNGVLDWVYMEELFTRGDVTGYWWSPDSRRIAYLEIDESPVKTFPIVDFVPVYNTAEMQHYPKAGAPNPVVRIGVYELSSGETTWLDVDTSDDGYIARVYWLGNSRRVAVEKLNRDQDDLRLVFADPATGETREILRETKPTWINITYEKHYYETKDRFVWSSERSGNLHLDLYDYDGKRLNAITSGTWEVTELNAVEESRGHVYFTGLKASVLERHLYRVSERGSDIRQITREPGTHNVTFSPDCRYYVDRFSSVDQPRVISVHEADGKELFRIDECDTSELEQFDLPRPEFITFTSSAGLDFYASIMRPTDFDPSNKYPVLVYTYGGPHAQVVRNVWSGSRYLWHAYMASRGYIIFSMDNRGSYGRGTAWEDAVVKNLGAKELEDQLAGVEYLKALPYVDANRIGIWGWSYGGYMTSLAMFKAPGVYRAGAAVAPVTDWHFYDSIYTERYMKRPEDNVEGYTESAPINFVDGLQSAFLLVHGTADDNVHLANSMRLAHELIEAGKNFELMIYPRKLHGISGTNAQVHLYRRLTAFFDRYLMNAEPPAEVP